LNCKRIQDEANIMRIDFNALPQTLTANQGIATQNATAGGEPSNTTLAPDQAQLSTAHAQVQALAAQVVQLPELRQERVVALRQTVQNGSYRPSSEQVAQAIFCAYDRRGGSLNRG
jgi:flagellar biosynthesis anti-sigma factor FlgM